jgi:hypothetical protein
MLQLNLAVILMRMKALVIGIAKEIHESLVISGQWRITSQLREYHVLGLDIF